MTETASDLTRSALAWHLRLRDGNDADWAAFADWLAQHPDHASAYDQVEAMDLALAPALGAVHFPEAPAKAGPQAANDDPAPRSRWPWLAGGAIAAALALALFMGQHRDSLYQITTGPGETRVVHLDPDTQVTLNGQTRMTFDHADARFARLEDGEALFAVRHDPARPFTLDLPGARVVDVGTVFDVVSLPARTRVAVAQGAVDYRPDGQSIALHAGQQAQLEGGSIRVSTVDPQTVNGWRQRRLTYQGSPLEQVAQDLGRVLGATIRVDAAIARQPVFGTIDLRGMTVAQIPRLASALDVRVVRHGKEWVLKPAHGHTP
jgi:transmembrane sensor